MVAFEPRLPLQSQHPQGRRYGAAARGQDRAAEQDLRVAPDAAGEQWRERRDQE